MAVCSVSLDTIRGTRKLEISKFLFGSFLGLWLGFGMGSVDTHFFSSSVDVVA